MVNQTTPLLVEDPTAIPMYDPQAMILMEKAIAHGYIIFLIGGDPAQMSKLRENKIKRSVVELGFSAITQGNVLEACFGITHVDSTSRDSGVSRTVSQVRTLKALFEEAAEGNESIRKLAVATYLRAFEIVTTLCDERDQLNCLTRCFFYRRVTKKAQLELQNNFLKLQEVMQSSR